MLSPDICSRQVVSSRDPLQLPWKEMDIDLVIEGTGVFVDSKGAGKHIEVPSRFQPAQGTPCYRCLVEQRSRPDRLLSAPPRLELIRKGSFLESPPCASPQLRVFQA